MMTTMRAVVADGYGSPRTLTVAEMPMPRPGPGQVQVRVRAAALNPADLRTLSGVFDDWIPLEFPHVPGSDLAGVVSELGPGVTRFAVGDEIFGLGLPRAAAAMAALVSTPPSLTTGTMAQYAVLEADTPALASRPESLDAEQAAALPMVGLTALALLRAGRFQPGETVLVLGATGGTGSAVVPLLAAAKVRIIATALPTDERRVLDLGAHETIDYRATDPVAETARRYPNGVDAVVNLALPGDELLTASRVVRPGGRVLNIAYPAADPAAFAELGITAETVFTAARPGDLEQLAAWAADGTLPTPISRRYRLGDGAQAYLDLVDDHTRGKLIVVMDAR